MNFLKSILLSFSMFSSIPIPHVEWNEKNMRFMMISFPLVGFVILLLSAAWFLLIKFSLSIWNLNISLKIFALGFLLIPLLVSGGIHLDGFMDTCDAVASHASREKKLEILKDSHSGAFAVLGCVIYFLTYYIFSLELLDYFYGEESGRRFINHFTSYIYSLEILPIFVLSRLLSAFSVATFPIAKNSGLVHSFASASDKKLTAILTGASYILISLGLIILYKTGFVIVATTFVTFIYYYFFSKKNFGGINGDLAGWFLQICELSSLAIFVIALKLI